MKNTDYRVKTELNEIKAELKQEPKTDGDCISRAFLIDRLLEKVKTQRSTIEIVDKLIPLIKDLPPVNPQEKTGHWIYKNDNWHCSECDETPKTYGYVGSANFMKEHFKFCNHCGCRMSEVSE